jgi:hypothetical protein
LRLSLAVVVADENWETDVLLISVMIGPVCTLEADTVASLSDGVGDEHCEEYFA